MSIIKAILRLVWKLTKVVLREMFKPKRVINACLAMLLISFLTINYFDIHRFVVKEKTIKTKKLKKGKQVKFLLLADLHSARFGRDNKKLIKKIYDIDPDYVIIAGDMMTARRHCDNEDAIAFMNALTKNYKVYYGLGNHEYRSRIYPDTYGNMYKEYFDAIASRNLTVLDNDSVTVGDFEILGLTVDRKYYKRLSFQPMEKDYVKHTIGEADPDKFSILIAHNPEYGDAYFDYGADLFVSGHLHGGIIRLPGIGGVASPSFKLFPKYSGGLYEKRGRYGYVSCGLGTHTVPIRFNNPGEITVITVEGE